MKMDGRSLKNKQAMKRETKGSPKPRSNTNSKSSTCSMNSHMSSSGSEFGSYCEISLKQLVERQNSQNEEKEGLLGAQTQDTQNLSSVQNAMQSESCQSCVNQNYKGDKQHVVDVDKEIYEQIDTKKFSSTSDTDWTVSDISGTKKTKSKRAHKCAGCCCTITLSTVFSVVISVSLVCLLLRYSNEPAMMSYHPEGKAQVLNTGQVKQFNSFRKTLFLF